MPQSIFESLSVSNPRYRLHHSRTVSTEYYANICESGANFGDFYLFNEPGHAFFPTSVEEASRIAITKLPLVGTFELRCGWELGAGEFIFKHGIRR
jgi:hypothetical protein